MLRPVVRRSAVVVITLLLTSAVALSHDRNKYFDYQDRVDDEDIGPYSLGNSDENGDELSQGDKDSPNKWVFSGNSDRHPDFKPSMMETYEKFKRQAVKTVVPGDETMDLTEGGSTFSQLSSLVSWQTATLISVLCVGAVILGVVLGVVYWPKAAFGERRDSSPLVGKKGSAIESAEERSLAHSAQMYHYQQQKQQMLAMEQAAGRVRSLSSNSDSEGECEEPDVSVYECPGLAAVGQFIFQNLTL
ncbi:unnamed protein product [Hymenolepis diminuta]|uniref:Neural proliferation differentiation and control protein 1 n=1 Tax=Hymenolepis diminuta TaxID=6216 RepID=A0A0R3SY86_HYMDI|nr:unnamed protein product [Hymenolepis diminuta]